MNIVRLLMLRFLRTGYKWHIKNNCYFFSSLDMLLSNSIYSALQALHFISMCSLGIVGSASFEANSGVICSVLFKVFKY